MPLVYNMIESTTSEYVDNYLGSLGAENYVKMIPVVVWKLRHLPH